MSNVQTSCCILLPTVTLSPTCLLMCLLRSQLTRSLCRLPTCHYDAAAFVWQIHSARTSLYSSFFCLLPHCPAIRSVRPTWLCLYKISTIWRYVPPVSSRVWWPRNHSSRLHHLPIILASSYRRGQQHPRADSQELHNADIPLSNCVPLLHLVWKMFTDGEHWPRHISQYYLGILPPLPSALTTKPSPFQSRRIQTRLLHTWDSAAPVSQAGFEASTKDQCAWHVLEDNHQNLENLMCRL